MVEKKLEDLEKENVEVYIKKELGKGFPLAKIKAALIGAGHPKGIVNDAIKAVKPARVKKVLELRPKKIPKQFLILLVAIVVIIVIYLGIRSKPSEVKIDESAVKLLKDELRKCSAYSNADILCISIAKRDISFLDKLEELITPELMEYYRNYFYTVSAFEDSSFCNKIIKEEPKIICENIIKPNQERCESIETPFNKAFCKSIATNDIQHCKELPTTNETIACEDVFYFYSAKNENECKKIQIQPIKLQCLTYLSKNVTLCTKEKIDRCYGEYNSKLALLG